MIRDIVWEWCGRAGLEHLRLDMGDAIRAEGRVVVATGDGAASLGYVVQCDAGWRFRSAEIEIDGAVHGILRDEAGWWVDGAPRPDLADCADIDIRLTPFTNTLPIRRIVFAAAPVPLAVAYIHVPEFSVSRAEQEYTSLGDGRFRYRSLTTGFTALLSVDADGVVIDYGDVWRRRAPRA